MLDSPPRLGMTFDESWHELRRRTMRGEIPSVKSSMWDKLVSDFASDGSPDEISSRAFRLNQNRGYNFVEAAEETRLRVRVEKARLWLSYGISEAFGRVSKRLWNDNAKSPRVAHLKGYPHAGRTLERMGLWHEYQQICRRLNISPESFNTAKLFYIASVVRQFLPADSKRLRVLEIGAGTGGLSVFLRTLLDVTRYVIVDIPEMMLLSSVIIRRFFPDSPIGFSRSSTAGPPPIVPETGSVFVLPQDIADLADDSFDVCVNIDSFQEMTEDQMRGYLALMRRTTMAGGLRVTLNRRKQVGSFDNNPLLYPYGPSDVLRWEVDTFFYEGLRRPRKDPHLIRVERIRK